MPSGANKLINAANTIKGNSQAELAKKLLNANEEAAKIKVIPPKKK